MKRRMMRGIGPTVLVAWLLLTFAAAAEAKLGSGSPRATMSSSGRTQRGEPGSSCWPTPSGPAVCADAGYAEPRAFMRVLSRARLHFRIGERIRPTEVVLKVGEFGQKLVGETNYTLSASLKPTWVVDLEPGRYDLALNAAWKDQQPNADASWGFGLHVVEGLPRTGPEAVPFAVAFGAWMLVAGAALRRVASP